MGNRNKKKLQKKNEKNEKKKVWSISLVTTERLRLQYRHNED